MRIYDRVCATTASRFDPLLHPLDIRFGESAHRTKSCQEGRQDCSPSLSEVGLSAFASRLVYPGLFANPHRRYGEAEP